MNEYDHTPSFYNTDVAFKKFLGHTSYYAAIQAAILTVVGSTDPDRVAELGSGTGQTALRIADEHPTAQVIGIDNRSTVIDLAREKAADRDLPNVAFETADMTEYVEATHPLPELLVFLHSFHHVPDPLERKVELLENCYGNLPDGGHICIGETFLANDDRGEVADRRIQTTWAERGLEAYASTFWSVLDGLSSDEIEHAKAIGDSSREKELEAGEKVLTRDEEYLISMNWVLTHAQSIGFEVVLAEPVNSLGDGLVLLRK